VSVPEAFSLSLLELHGAERFQVKSVVHSMESILLRTRRLQLRSATPELAAADLNNRFEFSRLLQADVPQDWPPPLNDDNSKAFTLRYLEENPDAAGWAAWYFLLPGKADEKAQSMGIGGFKGKPSSQGVVEVGYSIMPDYQRLGFGSEAKPP
jgi:[ribosomal protein S5]-alanine N-acetyltransferase